MAMAEIEELLKDPHYESEATLHILICSNKIIRFHLPRNKYH